MPADRIVVWRHGETDWNTERRYQGQADVALNATGLAQAKAAANRIIGLRPSRIVSSDLSRARATAATLGDRLAMPVHLDPRLQEIDVGDWAGMTNDEVFAANPDFAAALRAGQDARRSPTGETGAEAGAWVAEALRDIAESSATGSTVVVVGHGFGLQVAMVFLLRPRLRPQPHPGRPAERLLVGVAAGGRDLAPVVLQQRRGGLTRLPPRKALPNYLALPSTGGRIVRQGLSGAGCRAGVSGGGARAPRRRRVVAAAQGTQAGRGRREGGSWSGTESSGTSGGRCRRHRPP
ncbi:MAG: histidine phosphatase family protein [Micropruina sp.]